MDSGIAREGRFRPGYTLLPSRKRGLTFDIFNVKRLLNLVVTRRPRDCPFCLHSVLENISKEEPLPFFSDLVPTWINSLHYSFP